ncbi:MAG: D-alanyl-D-alanine carboxypeptidase family protein [bacterium]|nr:D-alanyl-D-alanine carboxypeptidase family protein [bacterium]
MSREFDDIIAGKSNGNIIKKFGITHYRYSDCNLRDLIKIDGFRVERECAEIFKEMKKTARKDGIRLKVVSGYRSSKYQIQVFRSKFNGEYPTEEQMKMRLKYSAPSGFSEHHTGLAIDICETEECFKDTEEYKWLLKHANEYGFEMSFPENNEQGLGFEPWHWRYVGKNGEYKHIFKEARKNDLRYKNEY